MRSTSLSPEEARWRSLMDQYLLGSISAEDASALEAQLRRDRSLRKDYLRRCQMETVLRREAGERRVERSVRLKERVRPFIRWPIWLASAAAAVALLVGGAVAVRTLQEGVGGAQTVEIVSVSEDAVPGWKAGDRLRLREIRMTRGQMQVRLAAGVMLDLVAPMEMQFVNAMHLRVVAGKISADVGEKGKGFVIETPQARVVDLGTRFGVDASNAAHTDVVVFSGVVEVFHTGDGNKLSALKTGQAVRVEKHRRTSRIVTVTGADSAVDWSTQGRPPENALITKASDSMSATDEGVKKWPTLRNFYRIVPGGLRDGASAFSDAADVWSEVPERLKGADQVCTFSTDSLNWFMTLTLQVARPLELFVFLDQRNAAPGWVQAEFTDTGDHVVLEVKPPQWGGRVAMRLPFSIWRREVRTPGEITLGAPYPGPPPKGSPVQPNQTFGIAAKALP